MELPVEILVLHGMLRQYRHDFTRGMADFDLALQADPAMPMALCLQGYFMHLMGLPALAARASGLHESVLKINNANARERTHIAALGAWCDGELERACSLFDAILNEHPRDMLALKLANYLYFYLGDAANVRDGPARALKAWDEGAPGYGHLLALHAFEQETMAWRQRPPIATA